MKSIVRQYYNCKQNSSFKFDNKTIVELMAYCFYKRMDSFDHDFMRDLDNGYITLSFVDKNEVCRNKYDGSPVVFTNLHDKFASILKDIDANMNTLDINADDFQKYFLEGLKKYIDQEPGVTLNLEQSVVQNPFNTSQSFTIQLVLDVEAPITEEVDEKEEKREDTAKGDKVNE